MKAAAYLQNGAAHHHFELLGWSETQVKERFWPVAVLWACQVSGAGAGVKPHDQSSVDSNQYGSTRHDHLITDHWLLEEWL